MNKEFSEYSVSEILNFTKRMTMEEKLQVTSQLLNDKRKSVNKIGNSILKEKKLLDEENERTRKLYEFEMDKYNEFSFIAGIDEVGRGPLAGPVVACAVILPRNFHILNLNDSKKISEKNREILYEEICQKAISIGIGMANNFEIDEINILNATKLAMKRALEDIKIKPDCLMIDAVSLNDVDIKQFSIVKGDEKVASISAASIVAKVVRDRMMVGLSEKYSNYDFENNKGYGTAKHYKGINAHGICNIHRKSFLKGYV